MTGLGLTASGCLIVGLAGTGLVAGFGLGGSTGLGLATGNGFTGSGSGSGNVGASGAGAGLAVIMLGGADINMACMTFGGSGNCAGFA